MTITLKSNPDGVSGAIQVNGNDAVVIGTQGITQGAPLSFRNKIINGNLDVWQRGTSFSCVASQVTYTADRWAIFALGNSVTADRVANNLSGGGFYALRVTGSTGNTRVNLLQRIESLNAIALQSQGCKISFFAVASTNLTLSWSHEYANSQDNFSASTTISSGTINVTTTPTKFTLDIAASNLTYNGLVFTLGASSGLGAGQTFTVTQFQLEAGTVATPFEHRPYGTELALCQRYYQQFDYTGHLGSPGSNALAATKYGTGDAVIANFSVTAPMRTAPTITSTNTQARCVLSSGIVNYTIQYIVCNAAQGTGIIALSNSSYGAGFGWVDTIGLVRLSAEL